MKDLFGNKVEEVAEFDEPEKRSKFELFNDFLPDFFNNKKNIMRSHPEAERDFLPWIINKAMSQHMDCVLHANEMNLASNLPKFAQYDYYIHAIRKGKRYGWQKKHNIENLDLVMRHYNISEAKATVAMKLLSEEDIEYIKQANEQGGRNKM